MPRCDHAAFRVADLDRSIEFYERVLPARLVSRGQHDDRWRTEIATLVPEGHEDFRIVLLMPRRVRWLLRIFHALVPRQTRSHEHLGFVCASNEELAEREAAARGWGARVAESVTRMEDRESWLLEIRDPDGNAVEWTCGETEAPPRATRSG
jgi:catechol 2,3-dioxygenase-like lactoylglutathione lyase family enzyme